METLIAPAINLVILLVVLTYYARSPLVEFVKARRIRLETEMDSVRQELHTAKASLDEYSSKLKAIGVDAQAMTQQATEDAKRLGDRLVSSAKDSAGVLLSDVSHSVTGVYAQLKSDLRAECASLVVIRAESLMKDHLTGEDKERIRREFSHQVEGARG